MLSSLPKPFFLFLFTLSPVISPTTEKKEKKERKFALIVLIILFLLFYWAGSLLLVFRFNSSGFFGCSFCTASHSLAFPPSPSLSLSLCVRAYLKSQLLDREIDSYYLCVRLYSKEPGVSRCFLSSDCLVQSSPASTNLFTFSISISISASVQSHRSFLPTSVMRTSMLELELGLLVPSIIFPVRR